MTVAMLKRQKSYLTLHMEFINQYVINNLDEFKPNIKMRLKLEILVFK